MPFQTDRDLAAEVESEFGEYLITFISDRGQVRADLYRRRGAVVAHVSFPTGLDGGSVTDPYVVELSNYAREHGLEDHFKMVYS
jgi:hypothetical protein